MGRGRKRHRRAKPEPQATGPVSVGTEEQKPIASIAELVAVVPEDVAELWPLAESLIASELPNTDWTSEQLMYACINGVGSLWLVCNERDEAIAALVTILTDRQRCLVAICSGNNIWEYLDARHQLYDWAASMGMKEVTYYGRPALAKLMPECKKAGVILRKEL